MYNVTLPKPTKKPIPSLRYYVIKHHGFTLLEGYCSCPKIFNTLAIPLIGYPRNT
jgi:predicted nucleic acid-binding Zn finger protein